MECNIKNIFRILLVTLCILSTGATEEEKASVIYRPSKYKLHIITVNEHYQTSNKPLTYTGTVTVDFVREGDLPADKDFKISLNTNPKTVIKKLTLKGPASTFDGDATIATEKDAKVEKNLLTITCKKDFVKVTEFQLEVEFTNPFGNDMTGIYRSSYVEDTKTRWLVTTHFEPIFARDAFPCFDQPNLKAIFKIFITVPKSITSVLSNTFKIKKPTEKDDAESVTYEFEEAPYPMSTYLVAFTASNFVGTSPAYFGKELKQSIKTFGRTEIIRGREEGELAQVIGVGALNKLAEYLDEPYSFNKIDQIGIPDFSAGAMENWGHVSFREKSLFYNKKTSSTSTKQANVLTITHELVHQWFGNLVTLDTWDFIWLNEAFANYIEYIIADQLPESSKWNLLHQMVVNEIHLRAFETDGLSSSKSLNHKIEDESLIYSSFNDIPYSKGAAVLRMWRYQLTDEKFQKALQAYIKDKKGKNARPEDLFKQLKAQGLTEDDFKTWTDQPGYPVVEIKKIGKNDYKITQSRFFWEKTKDDKSVWRIPLTFSTETQNSFNPKPDSEKMWLHKEPITIKNRTWEWVILNNQQAGYYRVNYDKDNWEALSLALTKKNYSGIPELNRAQIINDIFSLARSLQSNYVSYLTALKAADYLKTENSAVVWKTALNAFDFLQTKLYNEKIYDSFKSHVLSLAGSHFKGLNFSGTDHVEKLKNVEISRWACSLGLESCVKEAKALFKDSTYSDYPDTQEIVLCTAVREDKKSWEKVFEKYKKEVDSAVKLSYISVLGCSGDAALMEEFLNKTLNPVDIRKQDLSYVLSAVYNGNLKNVEIAFKFVEKNYETIAKDFGGINPLGKALVGIAKKLKTQEQVERLKKLAEKIKKGPEGGAAADSVENALNIAKSNLNWVNERMEQVKSFYNAGSILSYSFALLLLCLLSVVQF